MLFKNTLERYGLVAIIFHWLIAILIIGMLALGLYMVKLPVGLEKLKLFGWHKEIGFLILMLAVIRIIWRINNISPLLPTYMPMWQKFAARLVHYAFYIFMFALPISGWCITSAAGLQVSFFGLFLIPTLFEPNKEILHLLEEIHEWLAYGLIVTIILHISAVIEHYIVYKDNILRKIWPKS